MKAMKRKLGAIQNVGLLDRIARVLIGAGLMLVVMKDVMEGSALGWHVYLPIIAIYPFITAILGWDPLYATGHVKSCDTSKRNRCGTLPFEVEAAVGKKVECDEGYDCSVAGSHHKAA